MISGLGRAARTAIALAGVSLVSLTSASPLFARSDDAMPPWFDSTDVPLPLWARSVTSTTEEGAIFTEPGRLDLRRGSAQAGARLPVYATHRGLGCPGRWLNVGPLAWICSDVAEVTGDSPFSPPLGTRPWTTSFGDDTLRPLRPGTRGLPPIEPQGPTDDGLPYRYFFAGRDGAYGFANLDNALDDAPDQELEPGFALAILEERTAHGERWGRTKKGRWVAMRELSPAHPNVFHGELLDAALGRPARAPEDIETPLDLAWVVADKANVYATDKAEKPTGLRLRFEKVRVFAEKPGPIPKDGGMVRVSADGEPPAWIRVRDLARPRVTPPPADVAGDAERWIDVDRSQQTLVAYEGKRPVFATLVSTGKGPAGSEFATHPGTFRIWVKIFTTKMDNLDKEDVDRHYAIEDVPWVQFFDKAIALHGAFWHRDFGHVHSHGCVNIAPLDARWVFAFTSPHLPTGWSAVLPTKIEQGAVVRVR